MTKTIKFKIQEDTWTCRLLSPERYRKIHEQEGVANTDFDKRIIDFTQESATMKIIVHEITHAYNDYLNLQDTNNIPWDDLGEILATSSERNLLLILEKSLKVYNKFASEETNKHDREMLLKLVLLAQKWV